MIHKSTGTVGQYKCGARKISDLLLEVLEDKCKQKEVENGNR